MLEPAIEPVCGPTVGTASPGHTLHIDCHACTARPLACADCVVSFLLGGPPDTGADLDETEVAALAVLADSGMVPPLRLVTEVRDVPRVH